MKIRITGLPAEVTHAITVLNDAGSLDLIEVSGPYPNRGDSRMVRVYAEARLHVGSPASSHTGDELKTTLFADRDQDIRAAGEHLRSGIRARRGRRHRPD